MAGGEHDSGRVHGARHHSETEAGRRAGDCGIPAQQDRAVMRILEAQQIGRLLSRKSARLAQAEATVRPILEAVRQWGDRALMEYARNFDGLERRSVRVPERELSAAKGKLEPAFRRAVKTAAANIRAYAERQM